MLGDTVEIKMEWDAEELWLVSAVIMAGLILHPDRVDVGWPVMRGVAVREALLLRGECEYACVPRKEVAGDGEGRGVDSGSGGGAAAVVQPAEGSPVAQRWAPLWPEVFGDSSGVDGVG